MADDIPADVAATLAKYHFDRIPFEKMRARIGAASDLDALHTIRDAITPGAESDVHPLPAYGSAERAKLAADGAAAIARGELASVVLAGGMATRFGSMVKGLAPLFDEKPTTFLDAKLADIEHGGRGKVDVTLMTSFATDAALEHAITGRAGVHRAPQFASLRLTARGELFRDSHGTLSLHATGHGDLPEALVTSGAMARLRAAGVRTVLVSNVDNLGATLDPALYALHRRLGRPITVELVRKIAGDKGGIPVRHGAELVLAEAFRLPKSFPQDEFPLFNTNTLWIDLDAMAGEFPWTWCIAKKKVDGLEAIQIERLVGELTWWRPASYVEVARDGVDSRFIPIKEMDDLRKSRAAIETVLRERVGMTP
jgi:UTP--glucose-1-phosphate uridylyltransferase